MASRITRSQSVGSPQGVYSAEEEQVITGGNAPGIMKGYGGAHPLACRHTMPG